MAETIVNLVLGKLADVVLKDILHLYSVNEQIEKVGRELKRIQAFLKDADRKQITDKRQKNWVKEVRDIAHSIEDVIDTFLIEIPQNPQKPGKREAIENLVRKTKKLPAVHNLVDEMNQIQEKMKEIEESRLRYGINNLGEGSTGDIKLPVRPTVLPDIDPDIVGFKADQDHILKELVDETTKRRSVVSICGTGGIGKTTLARKVYNCNDVIGQFELRIWVAISEKFEIIDVLRKILLKITQQFDPSIELSDLPNEIEVTLTEIHKSLRGKNYLIVLDDVWTIDLWTQIGDAFPDENNGSKLLVTTRFADVPKGMDTNSEPHKLQFLTEDLSRELLLKTVFPNHDSNETSFDDLSDIIGQFVHKCGGLPLALVVLGGFLSKKPRSHAVWSSVFWTMSWHVEGKNCSEIVGTSYEDLPFAIKSCFMYFSAFPEDYDIDAQSLLPMWIAEGFIPQEDNRTLEETAESFLEDLVQRSMVQVGSRSAIDGSIRTLLIHDLLRDLALKKAKEENFLLVYSNPNDKMNLSRARRVAIHNPDCDELIMSPNLHTLLCFYNGSMPNCSKQRLLKVVRNGEEYKNKIELGMFVGLTQLRYLRLSGRLSDNCDQEFFEKVIGRMKFLQTLLVFRLQPINASCFEFPKSAWNIKTLRHVFDLRRLEPPTSTKLTNLQTIKIVRATQSWEIELPHIPNIRSLQLEAESSPSKAVVTFMSTLELLTDLYITHDHSVLNVLDMRSFPFYNHLQSLSLHYNSPTKLTQLLHEDMLPYHLIYLSIWDYEFQQDIVLVLEKLRCLKYLIVGNAFESRKMTCSSGSFSQLKILKLFFLSMEEWEIEKGAMPMLKELLIQRCDKLSVPQGLQYLTNLQKLEWRDVGDSKADLIRNLCQHVPNIDLVRD